MKTLNVAWQSGHVAVFLRSTLFLADELPQWFDVLLYGDIAGKVCDLSAFRAISLFSIKAITSRTVFFCISSVLSASRRIS